jgi:hypothetical protein
MSMNNETNVEDENESNIVYVSFEFEIYTYICVYRIDKTVKYNTWEFDWFRILNREVIFNVDNDTNDDRFWIRC